MPFPKDPIKRGERIKKFSDKLRGKLKSEEHRRKMSEAHMSILFGDQDLYIQRFPELTYTHYPVITVILYFNVYTLIN